MLVFAPLVLTLAQIGPPSLAAARSGRAVEAAILFGGGLSLDLFLTSKQGEVLPALVVLLFVLWATLRFGKVGTALTLLVFAVVLVWNLRRDEALLGTVRASAEPAPLDGTGHPHRPRRSVLGPGGDPGRPPGGPGGPANNEARYRSLVELSPDAILIIEDDRIRYCNPASLALFGAGSPEALLGTLGRELLHPDDRAASAAHLRTVLETSRPVPPPALSPQP